MEIPMNQPSGGSNNIRLRNRGGELASDLPPPMVVDEPVNTNAD
jgi:N-acetylglucosamine-6-sulfatase